MKSSRSVPRWFLLALLVTPLLRPATAAGAPVEAAPGASGEIVLLNWGDYIDPDLVKKFEHDFHAKVRQVYYESDDLRDAMLAESDGRGYDVALVNGAQLGVYRKRGWLAPISESAVPNFRYIAPRWANAFPAAVGYAVPYFWGTLGIAYRSDLIPGGVTSWKQLFEPGPALRGKIAMINSSRDVIGMALKTLGYSVNSTDPRELAAAQRLMEAQKPYVKTYHYVDLDEKSQMVTGAIVASMFYSSDALMLKENDDRITYVVPKEGSNLWVDYLVVMRAARNPKLATAFVNFLNEPHNAAQSAEWVEGATPNRGAEKLLSTEFLRNSVRHPDAAVIARSEFYRALPPRGQRKRNMIFAKLMK